MRKESIYPKRLLFDDDFNILNIDLNDDLYYIEIDASDYKSIPHFHIHSFSTECDISICLFEPKYFQSERNYQVLSSKKIDILDNFLKSKYRDVSVWEYLVILWEMDCSESIYNKYRDKLFRQPDYSKMTEKDIRRRTIWQAIVSKWMA